MKIHANKCRLPGAVDLRPTAVDDAYTVVYGAGEQTLDVLANDAAGNGASTIVRHTAPAGVTMSEGAFRYTPPATGPAGALISFTYTISDEDVDAAMATVTITRHRPRWRPADGRPAGRPGERAAVPGGRGDHLHAERRPQRRRHLHLRLSRRPAVTRHLRSPRSRPRSRRPAAARSAASRARTRRPARSRARSRQPRRPPLRRRRRRRRRRSGDSGSEPATDGRPGADRPTSLPFTGGSTDAALALGTALSLGGLLLVLASRRRRVG